MGPVRKLEFLARSVLLLHAVEKRAEHGQSLDMPQVDERTRQLVRAAWSSADDEEPFIRAAYRVASMTPVNLHTAARILAEIIGKALDVTGTTDDEAHIKQLFRKHVGSGDLSAPVMEAITQHVRSRRTGKSFPASWATSGLYEAGQDNADTSVLLLEFVLAMGILAAGALEETAS